MKKIISVLVSMVIVSGAAFAKTWTNHIGAGIGVSVESLKDEDGEKIFQAGFMFDATYIGTHANGFTVKGGIDSGALASDDVKLQGNDTNVGPFVAFNFGAGYSFVRTEKVLFGATGMFTYAFNSYEKDVTVLGKKYTNTFSIGAFGIGADVFGSLNLTEHFGLYANFGLRYLFAGAAEAEILGVKSDGNLKGNVAVLPSLGVMWKF